MSNNKDMEERRRKNIIKATESREEITKALNQLLEAMWNAEINLRDFKLFVPERMARMLQHSENTYAEMFVFESDLGNIDMMVLEDE